MTDAASKKDAMKEKLEDVEQALPTKGGGDKDGHPKDGGGAEGGVGDHIASQRVVLPGAVAVRGVGPGMDLADESLADTEAAAAIPTSLGHQVSLDAVVAPDDRDFEDAVKERLEEKMKSATKAEVLGTKGSADDVDGKARRNTMIMTIFGLGVVCFVIALAVMLSYGDSDSSDGKDAITGLPMDSPDDSTDDGMSTYELALEQLKSISDEEMLLDSSMPQYQALEWISKHDATGMELIKSSVSDEGDNALNVTKFVERYILGLLYYSTSGPEWFSNVTFLSESSVCDWTESAALHEEGGSTGGDGDSNSTETDEEEFEDTRDYGIRCNDLDEVVEIKLFANKLNGTLPSELSKMSSLEGLDMSGNELEGTIPSGWGDSLQLLQRINLGYNSLVGSIPSSFSKLRKLNEIEIPRNGLNGSIPELMQMTNLKFLDLRGQQLSGTLPELPEDSKIFRIWLSFNLLTGSIPESWYKESIEHINVWFNMLDGPISPKIADCKELTYGDFDSNQLTGTIPTDIGLATNLGWIYLSVNQMTGTIPTELGLSSRLQHLWLHDNEFVGTVPSELAEVDNMSDLFWLTVQGNQLVGDMDAFCSQDEIVWSIEADCGIDENYTFPLMDGNGTFPRVDCPCCVKCCDGNALSGPGVISENHPTCHVNHIGACEVEKADVEVEGGTLYVEGAGTTCDCVSADNPDDPEDVVLSCVDAECESCNLDRSICAKNVEFTYDNFDDTLVQSYGSVTFKYTKGLNDTVRLTQWKPSLDDQAFACEVFINDQKCNACARRACPYGFRAFEVNCDNIPGAGRVDVCDQDPEDQGPLTVFALQDSTLLSGCPPRFEKI